MHEPALTRSSSGAARGLVLMLHGGADKGLDAIDERSLSWRRSRWMMHEIRGKLHDAGLDVWLLRYKVKGWNEQHGPVPSPVPDARWALEQVRAEHGDLPVVLLGHSMGGRTAVYVADDPSVVGVVALAPWLPKDESVAPLVGKHLACAHGRSDKVTSARATARFVERASAVAASAEMVEMGRVGHYMLRRRGAWNSFAVEHVKRFMS
ncbi:MAG TPA: alpha/beta fold hydrolase [Nocardioidaceae bacterium]|nr:alpha/beta fold hydrolase [Nocardioidaceae bacterium]